MPPHKGGKKNRKHGRNIGKGNHRRDKCLRYAAEHRRVKNNPERTQRRNERTPGSGRKPTR